MAQQRVVLVMRFNGEDNLAEVNGLLAEGWRVVSASPMGGVATRGDRENYGVVGWASLVVLEHP